MSKILKFYGSNCPACKQLDKFLAENNYNVDKALNVDTDYGADVASEFNVMSLPTLIKIDASGNIIDSVTGFVPTHIKGLFEDGY